MLPYLLPYKSVQAIIALKFGLPNWDSTVLSTVYTPIRACFGVDGESSQSAGGFADSLFGRAHFRQQHVI